MLAGLMVPEPGQPVRRPAAARRAAHQPGHRRRAQARSLAGLADGTVDIAIGTHALIQEAVDFHSLGVVVVDEQHRFGVEQRAALRDKAGRRGARRAGDDGDADPAHGGDDGVRRPRRERARRAPAGPHADRHPLGGRPARPEAAAWADVRAEVAAGRQAYVVCPLIEESEKLEVASAEETYERLRAGELAGLRLGLLHGRMPSAEKEAVMDRFRAGELDVLVATTVIEVGVDVPNATVMVILDADRFGIAQLHQLRGRVGRGAATRRSAGCVTPRPDEPGGGVSRAGARRWCAPPTASSWPRSTSSCAARAR